VPVDDRSLTASSAWSRATGTAYFLHTITTTSHQGAQLARTGVHAHHLALVVTTCLGCGSIAVYAGGTKLGSWSLAASSTHNEVTIAVSSSALSGVTISVKVTTTGKPVKIDALGVSAR
jgi:hypothetical protein